MVAPFSTLFKKEKPRKHHNKQTKRAAPEKQTKLPKREIKQTQNKLQIFHAK
jgi:hypothetical protein